MSEFHLPQLIEQMLYGRCADTTRSDGMELMGADEEVVLQVEYGGKSYNDVTLWIHDGILYSSIHYYNSHDFQSNPDSEHNKIGRLTDPTTLLKLDQVLSQCCYGKSVDFTYR